MKCNHPLVGFQVNKGDKVKFIPYPDTKLLDNTNQFKLRYNIPLSSKLIIMPCKQCVACRLAHSQEVANRIYTEVLTSQSSYGITLTYEDDFLPRGKYRYSLDPNHVTKFVKDLRRYFEYHFHQKGIRYYMCGEYGSLTDRPHYHFIFFNLDIPDLVTSKEVSQTGEPMFESKIISNIWSKGRVRINLVTWQYAAYCARYILKKQIGKSSFVYDELGIVPEFTRSSNRPGIGFKFLEDNSDKLFNDKGYYVKKGDSVKFAPLPKYYLDKLELLGYNVDDLKEDRKAISDKNFNQLRYRVSKDIFEYLDDLEGENLSKSKALPRL